MESEEFLNELRRQIQANDAAVSGRFAVLTDEQLNWRASAKTWSIGQCIDHLNLTHDYYRPKLADAWRKPAPATAASRYTPSFWGRIYMHFALNAKYSFPTAPEITPGSAASRSVLADYTQRQRELLALIATAGSIDLTRTAVPIAGIVQFNVGDCLKVLAFHDKLHIEQALGVLAAMHR